MEKEEHILDLHMIRHGFSEFNKARRNHFDPSTSYICDNYSPEFIDAPLDKEGIEQAEAARTSINNLNIKYTFVSPLLRTLETAQILLETHPQRENIKIIVHPLLRELMVSSCDIPRDISPRITKFLEFDFSLIGDGVKYWVEDINQELREEILEGEDLGDLEFIYKVIMLMRKRKEKGETFETEQNVRYRLNIFIHFITQYFMHLLRNKVEDEFGDVLIVTHGGICKYFTATHFKEDGTAKEGCFLRAKNCQIFHKQLLIQ